MPDPATVALLLLRLAVGGVMLAHGVKHARGREKTSGWFASIGFTRPQLQWFLSTATEIGVGVLLIVGALTPLAAAGLVAVMTVAYWTVHRQAGFWVTARPDEGWEYVFILSVSALALAMLGPGAWSVDGALSDWLSQAGVLRPWSGWWAGGGIALLGVPAAALVLLLDWRPERSEAADGS